MSWTRCAACSTPLPSMRRPRSRLRPMKVLEEHLRLALEGTETGFWEWDIASDTVEWSDNMGPMYGLPRGAQPTGYAGYMDELVDASQRAEVRERVRQALADGRGYEHDLRVVLGDG